MLGPDARLLLSVFSGNEMQIHRLLLLNFATCLLLLGIVPFLEFQAFELMDSFRCVNCCKILFLNKLKNLCLFLIACRRSHTEGSVGAAATGLWVAIEYAKERRRVNSLNNCGRRWQWAVIGNLDKNIHRWVVNLLPSPHIQLKGEGKNQEKEHRWEETGSVLGVGEKFLGNYFLGLRQLQR
jgi:hypothetical protein